MIDPNTWLSPPRVEVTTGEWPRINFTLGGDGTEWRHPDQLLRVLERVASRYQHWVNKPVLEDDVERLRAHALNALRGVMYELIEVGMLQRNDDGLWVLYE